MAEQHGPILVNGPTRQQGDATARELLRRGHGSTRSPARPTRRRQGGWPAQVRRYSHELAQVLEWINDVGYHQADAQGPRERHPQLRTLRDWLCGRGWRLAVPA